MVSHRSVSALVPWRRESRTRGARVSCRGDEWAGRRRSRHSEQGMCSGSHPMSASLLVPMLAGGLWSSASEARAKAIPVGRANIPCSETS